MPRSPTRPACRIPAASISAAARGACAAGRSSAPDRRRRAHAAAGGPPEVADNARSSARGRSLRASARRALRHSHSMPHVGLLAGGRTRPACAAGLLSPAPATERRCRSRPSWHRAASSMRLGRPGALSACHLVHRAGLAASATSSRLADQRRGRRAAPASSASATIGASRSRLLEQAAQQLRLAQAPGRPCSARDLLRSRRLASPWLRPPGQPRATREPGESVPARGTAARPCTFSDKSRRSLRAGRPRSALDRAALRPHPAQATAPVGKRIGRRSQTPVDPTPELIWHGHQPPTPSTRCCRRRSSSRSACSTCW